MRISDWSSDVCSSDLEAAPGFEACHVRAQDQLARIARWQVERDLEGELDDASGGGPDDDVRWYELSPRGFRLQRTPLDVSGPLRAHREASRAAWIFTSATLAVDGHFNHIATRLGLEDPHELLAPSPFDWASQALCYLPPGLPQPSARDYTAAIAEVLLPVLHASQGRAFVLFASHRALREAAAILQDGPWPLFVQGQAPREQLLQRFRGDRKSVV